MATTEAGYEQDFYAWAMHNAELLRRGRLNEIDAANIAEELEDMGRSSRRALASRLEVLLAHLLKWNVQRDVRTIHSNSWRATIKEQRRMVARLLAENPSFKNDLSAVFRDGYEGAVNKAVAETNLPESAFPAECPFTLEQTLDDHYWPD